MAGSGNRPERRNHPELRTNRVSCGRFLLEPEGHPVQWLQTCPDVSLPCAFGGPLCLLSIWRFPAASDWDPCSVWVGPRFWAAGSLARALGPASPLVLLAPISLVSPPSWLCPGTPSRAPTPRLSLMFHWPALSRARCRPITARGVVILGPIRSTLSSGRSHALQHLLCAVWTPVRQWGVRDKQSRSQIR